MISRFSKLFFVLGWGLIACGQAPISSQPKSAPKPTVAALPAVGGEPFQEGSVVFNPDGPAPWSVKVEVARTPRERAKGLMHRKSLGDAEGMLFVFERLSRHQFYMKNTYIPLDIIFLSEGEGLVTVVGILENMRPFDEVAKSVDSPSYAAVEVRSPLASMHGIKVGDRVLVKFRGPIEPGAERKL